MIAKKYTEKSKFRLRRSELLELVDIAEEEKGGDVDVTLMESCLGGKKQKNRAVAKSKLQYYTIVDVRDGSSISRCTPDQVTIFFDACRPKERNNFIAVERLGKYRNNEKFYTVKFESGKKLECISSRELQTFVHKLGKCGKSCAYEVVLLKENETLVTSEIAKKLKRVSGQCQSHRKITQGDCVQEDNSIIRSLTASTSLMPELDTVRIFFPCEDIVDIDSFIPAVADKNYRVIVRDPWGNVGTAKSMFKKEFLCSWCGKMQIREDVRRWVDSQGRKCGTRVLSFEFSVAKWYNFTNGINSGVEPSADLILYPCIQALVALHVELYTWDESKTLRDIVAEFAKRAEIRRFDLSLNFKGVSSVYKVRDYINMVSRCRVNRQNSHIEDKEHGVAGSVSWGTEKSPYRVIMYDKETEQKKYYSRKDGTVFMWFEDECGNRYEHQNEGATLKEKVMDFDKCRKEFYDANKEKFEGVYRYEVQFRTKFMQENHLMTTGKENIDNVLRMGEIYWRDILNRFDEQIGRTNFEAEKEREGLAKALDRLSSMKDSGQISRTVYSNIFTFITECLYRRWDVVRDELGKANFSNKYVWVKNNLNYDVKIECPKTPDGMPIMRIMPTVVLSHQQHLLETFRFVPAPVYKIAMGG